jgi:hypothetical protein
MWVKTMNQIEEFNLKTWYCHKCRTEAIERNPEKWHLDNSMVFPVEELKEDPEKSGYYLCKRHQE